MVKEKVSITLDEELIKAINEFRGPTSVSAFIENHLKQSLEQSQVREITLQKCDEIIELIDNILNPSAPMTVRKKILLDYPEMALRRVREKVLELKVQVLSEGFTVIRDRYMADELLKKKEKREGS